MDQQPAPEPPFWLTRDRFEGQLSPEVDVWTYPPIAEMYEDGDVLWIAPLEVVDRRATYHSAVPADQVRRVLHCIAPDDARQRIRVEARG